MGLDLDRVLALVSEVKDLDGVPIRVVTAEQLHEMKRDKVRPKDRMDAEALRQLREMEK